MIESEGLYQEDDKEALAVCVGLSIACAQDAQATWEAILATTDISKESLLLGMATLLCVFTKQYLAAAGLDMTVEDWLKSYALTLVVTEIDDDGNDGR